MRVIVTAEIIIQETGDLIKIYQEGDVILRVEQTLNKIGALPIMCDKRMVQVGLRFHFKEIKKGT